MKKDISPEMYNYNKFPGPEFSHFYQQVKAEGISSSCLKMLKMPLIRPVLVNVIQRFYSSTTILLAIGEMSNYVSKGFTRTVMTLKTNRISRLEDYIKEFCNFGCAYFVLENPNPKEITFEEECQPRRKKSSKSKPNRRKSGQTNPQVAPQKTNRSVLKRKNQLTNKPLLVKSVKKTIRASRNVIRPSSLMLSLITLLSERRISNP